MIIVRVALCACSLFAERISARPVGAEQSVSAILESVRQADGGTAWNASAAIIGTGKKRSFGLEGTFTSAELVGSGRFMRRANYGIVRNAEGLDASGRWRMDNSGATHPLDSDEALAVARTEAYLAGRAYLFPRQFPATLSLLRPTRVGTRNFDRIAATPTGGRAVELWIGRDDHQVHRAVIELSTVTETIEYEDYRPVGTLLLPFRIRTSNGDQPETGTAEISSYRVVKGKQGEALIARPRTTFPDARILASDGHSVARLDIDRATNFPIVWASIDGTGPLPFILDTGGHDILTPREAKNLGLSLVGNGFSLGAGAGSAPTKFTQVSRLLLGQAQIVNTPFTVLDVDLGTTPGPDGKQVPIAGLLGLELFERFRITLERGRVVLEDPRVASAAAGTSVPIRFTRDTPLIAVTLADHPAILALDTGNNIGLIVTAAWAKDSGLSARMANGSAENGTSVGGDVSMKLIGSLTLSIGSLNLGAHPAMVAAENMGSLSSRSEAGNIGLEPLETFDVVIDYADGMMTLRPTD